MVKGGHFRTYPVLKIFGERAPTARAAQTANAEIDEEAQPGKVLRRFVTYLRKCSRRYQLMPCARRILSHAHQAILQARPHSLPSRH